MFSEPITQGVKQIFNAPGIELEFLGAGILAVAVVCYVIRILWISLREARRLELEATRTVKIPANDKPHTGPYCAG